MIEKLKECHLSIEPKIIIWEILNKFSKTHNFDDLLKSLENFYEAIKEELDIDQSNSLIISSASSLTYLVTLFSEAVSFIS